MVKRTPTGRRRADSSAKILAILIVIVVAIGGAWKMAHRTTKWLPTIDDGLRVADREGKPILVLYTAVWCPPCQRLKKEVFKDPEVADYLEREYVLVKVDLSNQGSPNTQVAAEYGVESIPTMMVYNARGRYLDTYAGPRTKAHVMHWVRSFRR